MSLERRRDLDPVAAAWRDRRVVVVGAGRSGVAAARLLAWLGARVVLTDRRPAAELPRLEHLGDTEGVAVEVVCGGHPARLWEDAEAVIVSPGVPEDAPPLAAAREAGLPLVAEVELASRLADGLLVGVTGSNGKSTVTAMGGAVLAAAGRRVAVCGNIGRAFSDAVLERLAGEVDHDCWVVELSSFQTGAIDSLHPRIAVLLNLTPDHLDRHGSMEAYAAAKMRLLINCTPDDWLVLNADDPVLEKYLPDTPARRAVFSARPPGSAPATWLEDGAVWWRSGRDTAAAGDAGGTDRRRIVALDELQVLGPHNAANAAAAAAVGALAGAPPAAIARGLRDFQPLEHRMESCGETGGVLCVNDSKATNVDATRAALEGFDGGVWLILGGRDKGSDFARLRSPVDARVVGLLLIGEATERIAEALDGTAAIERCESLERAVSRGLASAAPGDVLLLSPACTSFDQFVDFEARGRRFKELVRGRRPDTGQEQRSVGDRA